jgi:hypothetical protein
MIMNSREIVSNWLADRVSGATLDDDGIAGLEADDGNIIMLEVPENAQNCHISSPAMALPENEPVAGLFAALELNRYGRPLGGCWLAWDPDIEMLMLCFNLYIPTSDIVAFNNTLDNFAAALKLVQSSFNEEQLIEIRTGSAAHFELA